MHNERLQAFVDMAAPTGAISTTPDGVSTPTHVEPRASSVGAGGHYRRAYLDN
jgi:hypothetical protein